MIAILTVVVSVVFKILNLAAKIAFNRITVILTFCASVGATVSYIFTELSSQASFVNDVFSQLNSFSVSLSDWVASNDYLQLIGYALSLDVILDGLVSTFVWVFCTLVGILITVSIYVFYAVLPLLADLAVTALRKQQQRILSKI